MRTTYAAVVLGLLLGGCRKPPTAMEACHSLEAAGLASNCREEKPHGLAADARDGANFDLPSVPGKGGGIFTFETEEAYEATVRDFEARKVLAGPHRYGNKKRLVFTQMNEGLSMELGAKVKKTLADL